MNFYVFIIFIILKVSFSTFIFNENKLIISLSTNITNINLVHKVIYSILEQNVDHSLYRILLILSKKDFINKKILPINLLFLINTKKIRIILIQKELNLLTKLLLALKEYPNNPILLINDNIIFPEGWLEMFINDHKRYPKDIISASIQYYFGNNLEIREFSEGYNGKNFGTFNHISNMVFNFALVNSNLGGTLYPSKCFKNKDFYNLQLFLNISKESDDFWQSFFIMKENKTLRQSSKIYDYTSYLINNNSYSFYKNKKKILKKIKKSFIKYFHDFTKIVKLRQQKIIVSFTSYYKRFELLANVVESIKSQIFLPKKILLFLYKDDYYKYNLNITGIEIIIVNEDLKPHKKYYYSMIKYRDYAIITLDDDIFYPSDTILSIYNSYINHPNIISGRRTHLITYKKNYRIENYFKWQLCQTKYKIPNYNIFITTGAGAIYPPDILNIEEKHLHLINEVITTDDICLKYYEITKGIESIWVPNKLLIGMKIKQVIPILFNNTLYSYNIIKNDVNINKLNIDISNIIIENSCIQYKNIKTGLTIHLFNIEIINSKKSKSTIFTIDAYSYCPINNNLIFRIVFNNKVANCHINNTYSIINKDSKIYKTSKLLRARCNINETITNFDDFYFPVAKTNSNIYLDISNKRKYIDIIFKDFYCINSFECILVSLFYKNRNKGYKINLNIFNKNYICKLREKVHYLNNNIPIIDNFDCKQTFFKKTTNKLFVGGIPNYKINKTKKSNNIILNQFIISKIFIEYNKSYTQIIIKGKLFDNLKKDINNLKIFSTYPNLSLNCYINASSKYIQSNIYCFTKKKLDSKLLIGNQIIYNEDFSENLILLNDLTLYQNYEILNDNHYPIFDTFFKKYLEKIIIYFNDLYLFILIIIIFFKFSRRSIANY